MSITAKLTVRNRLLASFALLALVTTLLAVVGVINVARLKSSRQDIAGATDVRKVRRQVALSTERVSASATDAALAVARGQNAQLAAGTDEQKEWQGTAEDLRDAMADLSASKYGAAEAAQVREVGTEVSRILALDAGVMGDYASTDPARRARGDRDVATISDLNQQVGSVVDDLVDAAAAQAKARSASADRTEGATTTLCWLFGALGLLLAAGVAYWALRSISTPLNRMLARVRDLADGDGDLRQRLDESATDELGQIAAAFNRFVATTESTVAQIDSGAAQLNAAVGGMRSVNDRMSGSATTTASRTQTVSSAAEEISVTMSGTASAAEQMSAASGSISTSAAEAARLATDGARMADEATPLVTGLVSAANEISSVVMLIQDVASQTKMLALNASIEAARAGEAGEGFAVVANEVKDLAAQTAEAATQVHERIETVQTQASQAATAIGDIAGHMRRVNDSQGEIATAVAEQTSTTAEIARGISEASTGAADIARSITEIAEAASSASSLVGQTTTSVEDLTTVASRLQELSTRFKYNLEATGPAPVSSAIPSPRSAAPGRVPVAR